jgi:hypothetical protein
MDLLFFLRRIFLSCGRRGREVSTFVPGGSFFIPQAITKVACMITYFGLVILDTCA